MSWDLFQVIIFWNFILDLSSNNVRFGYFQINFYWYWIRRPRQHFTEWEKLLSNQYFSMRYKQFICWMGIICLKTSILPVIYLSWNEKIILIQILIVIVIDYYNGYFSYFLVFIFLIYLYYIIYKLLLIIIKGILLL